MFRLNRYDLRFPPVDRTSTESLLADTALHELRRIAFNTRLNPG
jgi:hypothetical protein